MAQWLSTSSLNERIPVQNRPGHWSMVAVGTVTWSWAVAGCEREWTEHGGCTERRQDTKGGIYPDVSPGDSWANNQQRLYILFMFWLIKNKYPGPRLSRHFSGHQFLITSSSTTTWTPPPSSTTFTITHFLEIWPGFKPATSEPRGSAHTSEPQISYQSTCWNLYFTIHLRDFTINQLKITLTNTELGLESTSLSQPGTQRTCVNTDPPQPQRI